MTETNPQPRPLRLGELAPDFEARTTQGTQRLSSFRGRWLIFFSHPSDFTPVCTTEFVALAKAAKDFAARDCALLGLSVDSLYSHLAWVKAIKDRFDVEIGFPIVEDPSMAVGHAYGMIDESAADSSAMRSTYFIDPEGVIRAITIYPFNVGRSVPEMLRMLIALQTVAGSDALAPESWQPDDPLLAPPPSDASQITNGADWFCRTAASK